MEKNKKIYEIIDYQAVSLIGVLLKRIEVFQKQEEQEDRIILTHSLYKKIIKELVYENSRQAKALLRVLLEERVIFKSRPRT